MSHFSIALKRAAESRRYTQTDISLISGVSRSHLSRLLAGHCRDIADDCFHALLKVWDTSPETQAGLITARCLDILEPARAAGVRGASQLEISVRPTAPKAATGNPEVPEFPHVQLSTESERVFGWLRSQCLNNLLLEEYIIGLARVLHMPQSPVRLALASGAATGFALS